MKNQWPLKFTLQGLKKLTPFDESLEFDHIKVTPIKAGILACGTFCTFLIGFATFGLAAYRNQSAVNVFLCIVTIALIVAGFEWMCGFRARALNQFITICLIILSGLAIKTIVGI